MNEPRSHEEHEERELVQTPLRDLRGFVVNMDFLSSKFCVMHLGHIELFVRHPLDSREFYEGVLGFDVVAIQERNVWLKLDAIEILLRSGEPPQVSSYANSGTAIVLYTDDLNATAATLKSRGLQFAGTDGSPKCLTFHDPDGHWFQLVNPNDH